MRIRLNLSKQITIIFLSAFIITLILLGVFLSKRLGIIYESVIYDNLEAEGKTLSLYLNDDNYMPEDHISFITYGDNSNDYKTSSDILNILDESAIRLLIEKANQQTTPSASYVNTINNELIYYSIFKYQGFFNIIEDKNIIVLTDDTIKKEMVRSTFIKLFIYCFIAFLIGYFIILVWIRHVIKHIKSIQKGISALDINFYKDDILLNRPDELGELVTSINHMREQIYSNNKTKQELIQGISHDLKTPISVIKSYAEA